MADDPESEWLTIRLKPGENPIGGVVVSTSGETPFTGWIELTGLIESANARTAAAAQPSEKRSWTLHDDAGAAVGESGAEAH